MSASPKKHTWILSSWSVNQLTEIYIVYLTSAVARGGPETENKTDCIKSFRNVGGNMYVLLYRDYMYIRGSTPEPPG